MTVTRDPSLGMYTSDQVGGYFNTEEEAHAAESGTSMTPYGAGATGSDFLGEGLADPAKAAALTPDQVAHQQVSKKLWLQNNGLDEAGNPLPAYGTPQSQGGTATQYQTTFQPKGGLFKSDSYVQHRINPDGTMTAVADVSGAAPYDPAHPGNSVGTTAMPGANAAGNNATFQGFGADGTTMPGGSLGQHEAAAAAQAGEAGRQFQTEDAKNQAENDSALTDWKGAIDAIKGGDYTMSDEARGYQREGLQQQRDLLKKALGFDPNQYATQFADQALAREVAAGRSAGGGAAAQQAGMFAAMEQAPSLYAQGAQQASALENQRLTTAEGAAKAFGDLGTMTRNSDENRAQFESNLSTEIAKQIGTLTEGKIQMNEQDSQRFASVWTDFAELQSRYAGMDSTEAMHQLDIMMQQKGLDAQWAQFKDSQKLHGKDILGAFFQLGGGLIGAGGMIGAAYAGKK